MFTPVALTVEVQAIGRGTTLVVRIWNVLRAERSAAAMLGMLGLVSSPGLAAWIAIVGR